MQIQPCICRVSLCAFGFGEFFHLVYLSFGETTSHYYIVVQFLFAHLHISVQTKIHAADRNISFSTCQSGTLFSNEMVERFD